MSNAYQEGIEARRAGVPSNANPYTKHGSFINWGFWLDGWMREDRKIRLGHAK